jgi:hypothetical protein
VRAEHPHERVVAELFIRNPTLQQLNDLGQTRIEVQLLGLAEGLGIATKQQLRNRVTRQVREVFWVRCHESSPPLPILSGSVCIDGQMLRRPEATMNTSRSIAASSLRAASAFSKTMVSRQSARIGDPEPGNQARLTKRKKRLDFVMMFGLLPGAFSSAAVATV